VSVRAEMAQAFWVVVVSYTITMVEDEGERLAVPHLRCGVKVALRIVAANGNASNAAVLSVCTSDTRTGRRVI